MRDYVGGRERYEEGKGPVINQNRIFKGGTTQLFGDCWSVDKCASETLQCLSTSNPKLQNFMMTEWGHTAVLDEFEKLQKLPTS